MRAMGNEGQNLEEVYKKGGSLLLYTGSKVIEVVELESKLHSHQCFLNPHKYAESQFRNSLVLLSMLYIM